MVESYRGKVRILLADEGMKLTNSDRGFFSDFIYLGKNDSPDNYEEVPRAIWKHFIEDKSTDFDILSEKIEELQSSILQIEEISLQTDFKLLLLKSQINLQ